MDSRKHKLILGIALVLSAVVIANVEELDIQLVDPLPPMVVPGKPEVSAASAPNTGYVGAPNVAPSVQPLGYGSVPKVDPPVQQLSSRSIPEREVLTDANGNPIPQIAAAPVTMTAAKLLRWTKPADRSYMADLRQSILEAEAAGNIAERDRLFAIYQPWADKYLNPDSPTWVPPDEQ